jgi:transcriptional regulator with XRE-family HTH domain
LKLSKSKEEHHAAHTHSPRRNPRLADELEAIGLSAKKLADVIEVPPNRLYRVLAGKRNVTADTALRLSQYSAGRLITNPDTGPCSPRSPPAMIWPAARFMFFAVSLTIRLLRPTGLSYTRSASPEGRSRHE